MLRFFDWLLGPSQVGWLKTAVLSIILGMVALHIYDPTFWDRLDGGGERFYLIAIGYPILWIIRKIYWTFRLAGRDHEYGDY